MLGTGIASCCCLDTGVVATSDCRCSILASEVVADVVVDLDIDAAAVAVAVANAAAEAAVVAAASVADHHPRNRHCEVEELFVVAAVYRVVADVAEA